MVLATENGVEKVAGSLSIVPNAIPFRKKIKIAFINCITNINPGGATISGLQGGVADENILLDLFTKSFNQALIDLDLTTLNDLDLTNLTPSFLSQFKSPISQSDPNLNYLKAVDHAFLKNIPLVPVVNFSDRLSIFVLGDYSLLAVDSSNLASLVLSGEQQPPIGTPCIILYKSASPTSDPRFKALSTISHEGGHALSLYHSFGNDSDFTFRKYITDNIMDYVSQTLSPSNSRVCFYKFQWDKLNVDESNILSPQI